MYSYSRLSATAPNAHNSPTHTHTHPHPAPSHPPPPRGNGAAAAASQQQCELQRSSASTAAAPVASERPAGLGAGESLPVPGLGRRDAGQPCPKPGDEWVGVGVPARRWAALSSPSPASGESEALEAGTLGAPQQAPTLGAQAPTLGAPSDALARPSGAAGGAGSRERERERERESERELSGGGQGQRALPPPQVPYSLFFSRMPQQQHMLTYADVC
jgi:hypothetical protein